MKTADEFTEEYVTAEARSAREQFQHAFNALVDVAGSERTDRYFVEVSIAAHRWARAERRLSNNPRGERHGTPQDARTAETDADATGRGVEGVAGNDLPMGDGRDGDSAAGDTAAGDRTSALQGQAPVAVSPKEPEPTPVAVFDLKVCGEPPESAWHWCDVAQFGEPPYDDEGGCIFPPHGQRQACHPFTSEEETSKGEPPICPFCGSTSPAISGCCGTSKWVYCNECGANGPTAPAEHQAFELWNAARLKGEETASSKDEPDVELSVPTDDEIETAAKFVAEIFARYGWKWHSLKSLGESVVPDLDRIKERLRDDIESCKTIDWTMSGRLLVRRLYWRDDDAEIEMYLRLPTKPNEVVPSSVSEPKPESARSRAIPFMDWEQVRLNGGPPCFAVMDYACPLAPERPAFCGRAERGHIGFDHDFISLDAYLKESR